MHIRLLALALGAFVLGASRAEAQFGRTEPVPGENYHIEFGLVFWNTDPGIVLGSPLLNVFSPAPIDFVQALNLEKTRFTEFRSVLKGGKHKLRFSRVPVNFSQTLTPPATITIGGRPVPITGPTSGEVDWDMFRIGYEYDFGKADKGYIGFITEVKYNRITAQLNVPDLRGAVTLQDVKVPAPALGVVARVYPHKLVSITGEWTGFKVWSFLRTKLSDADTFEANFKDFDVYGTFSITRFIGVQGGYRNFSVDYIVDADTGDLSLKGLYFGGMVRF